MFSLHSSAFDSSSRPLASIGRSPADLGRDALQLASHRRHARRMPAPWPVPCCNGHLDNIRTMQPAAFSTGGVRLQPCLQLRQMWPLRACASDRNRLAATERIALPSALSTRQEYRRNVGICLVNKTGLVFAARSANFAGNKNCNARC